MGVGEVGMTFDIKFSACLLAAAITVSPSVSSSQTLCDGQVATIVGTDGDDTQLFGTDGDDVIAGLEGNDAIRGNQGNDVICGGPGHDFIEGGRGNDTLRGGQGADLLIGGKGDDDLFGGKDDDTLDGGPGENSCLGGAGSDVLLCGKEVPPDFEGVVWLHTNVSRWAVASPLSVSFPTSSLIRVQYDKAGVWPANSGGVNGNPWIFVFQDGKWYAATWEWLKLNQTVKNKSSVAGSHIKKAPLQDFLPVSGEVYGFMVSGLARTSERNVLERTPVVMVRWP